MQRLKSVRNSGRAVPAVPRYPGLVATSDGAHAVVWVEAQIAQAACVFPVPPSAVMADAFAAEFSAGKGNLWDEPLEFFVAESPHSAASTCEGFALAGGRVTSFTSGQGLVQMKEVLHSIAGKRLPVVLHVATRSLTSHARTIHCGHDDILGVLDCGWGILVARNAQEAADFTLVARRAAEASETPFLCAQDGFFTSHTLETVRLPEPELMRRFASRPEERIARVIDPANPVLSGPVQGRDSYMRGRVAQRHFAQRTQVELESAFDELAAMTGRRHALVRPYAMEDAELALVGMGSMMETAEATVDYLRRSGIRIGSVSVIGLRPFPAAELAKAIYGCRSVAVLERTDLPLAADNPLTSQVKAALAELAMQGESRCLPAVYSAVAGMGGREIRPGHMVAAANHMLREGRRSFVLGVKHPDAVEVSIDPDVRPPGSFTLRSHMVGGGGSGLAYEILATAASELFGLHVQAAARHGVEKKGLPASYHLTLASEPVRVHAASPEAEFVAILDPHAFEHGDPLDGLNEGGTLYIDGAGPPAELWNRLPTGAQRLIARRRIRVCTLDAETIARTAAAGRDDPVSRLRSLCVLGVFLRYTRYVRLAGLDGEQLFESLRALLAQKFSDRGCDCLDSCLTVIRRAYQEVEPVKHGQLTPEAAPLAGARRLRTLPGLPPDGSLVPSGFGEWIVGSYVRGHDEELSADLYSARSLMPPGTSCLRSFRDMAPALPVFTAANCTACMECVSHCPDAAIRASVAEPAMLEEAINCVVPPEFQQTVRLQFLAIPRFRDGLFGLVIDPDKCKGCGECVEACGPRSALAMEAKAKVDLQAYTAGVELLASLPDTPERWIDPAQIPGDILLSQRALAFGGGVESCIGCGEAAAVRLLLSATAYEHGQENVAVIAAPGCPSEFSSVYPFNPYRISWSNSLWQNAAAEAIGVRLKWNQEGLGGRKLWVIGGYTTMFESGLQSLSRLLASGLDLKVFVVDTEVFSSTGGQTLTDTLATDRAAADQPAVHYRLERRKELAQIAMMHPGVFVAQTTPAFARHYFNAVRAANSFPGTAIVVCYAGCAREHGIRGGEATGHAKLAVESRTFPLFVHDPRLGDRFDQCLSLEGNPAPESDWSGDASGGLFDFVAFARTESRFSRHFSGEGEPNQYLQYMQEDRLKNWRRLRELARTLRSDS